ncbi:MAG: septum formation inhibitor Maf [Epulopiscium sp.]|nr:septum formation inhibitor Maf [Candidatus Epulonipiscium sp.]
MKKIILASQSPRRQELLHQIGISFEVMTSHISEKIDASLSVEDQVKKLAFNKAQAIQKQMKEPCIIIGADTMVTYNNHILGKPKNAQDAYSMLQMLQGQVHTVYTGVAVLESFSIKKFSHYCFMESAKVYMKSLTKTEIWNYINSKEPKDKAGAYGIQGKGAAFIQKIEGDYYTVVGLPISSLYDVLKEKVEISKYWINNE